MVMYMVLRWFVGIEYCKNMFFFNIMLFLGVLFLSKVRIKRFHRRNMLKKVLFRNSLSPYSIVVKIKFQCCLE
ncbi:hypothetical protein DXA74_09350 [Bacteroides sp. OF04-15BH]|nr:hypothetical protein DXA74_09350 [Bacteroides sp. OF04-15BH]